MAEAVLAIGRRRGVPHGKEIDHRGGGVDQLLPARVPAIRFGSHQLQQVARLGGRLRPSFGGRRQQEVFDFVPVTAQRRLVGLDFGQLAPLVGRLLGRHAAVLIEVDRLVGHSRLSLHSRGTCDCGRLCRT